MSNKRAAMRREKEQKRKIEKHKNNNLELAILSGRDEGRGYAGGVVLNILHDQFGFGKDRIVRLLEYTSSEAIRFDQPGVKFVINHYANKFHKKILPYVEMRNAKNVRDAVQNQEMSDYFMSATSVMCCVLNQYFEFASNNKGTGRLDKLMEYATNEYIKIQCEPEKYTVDSYYEKLKENTGVNIG